MKKQDLLEQIAAIAPNAAVMLQITDEYDEEITVELDNVTINTDGDGNQTILLEGVSQSDEDDEDEDDEDDED